MSQIDYLRNMIKQSGYPLEMEISSLLDGKWQEVINTDSYYDENEMKTRDIDIHAYHVFTFKKSPLILDASFTVECKVNHNFAWVFFTRPYSYDYLDTTGQYFDGIQGLTENLEQRNNMDLVLEDATLHYSRFRKIAVCFAEFPISAKKNESGKKEIFEATMQLKKYIGYTNEQLLKSKEPNSINIQFPCIVFDGEMFEAQVKGDKVNVNKAKHVLLTTYQPSSYSTWDLGFLIDIVHRSYFPRYISQVENSVKSLQQTIEDKKRRILRNIELTQDLLPKTAHTK